jgi:hypothetical protein
MSLDYKLWGTIASFRRPGNDMLAHMDLVAARVDAQATLRRSPDYEDSHITSWGRLSLDEVERLVALEPDPDGHADSLALVRELFAAPGAIVSLYYADPSRGY